MVEETDGFEMGNNWLHNTFKFGVPTKKFAKGMRNRMPCFKFLDEGAPPPILAECGKQKELPESVIHIPGHVERINI